MMIRLLTCLLAVGLLPLAASAQANSDSIKHRNDCRLAIQVITTGQPAARSDWAMTFVRECAGFPAALRNSLSAARNSRDTAALARLTAPADWLRDGDVFTAAFELARDRGASPVARVFAIRVMMWVYLPGMELSYSHLIADGDDIPTCGGIGPSLHGDIVRRAPLPSGWEENGRALGRLLASDGTESVQVRQAARCLALVIPFPYAADIR